MTDRVAAPAVVHLGDELSDREVQRVATELATLRTPVVLDCHALANVTAAGVAALLELGRRRPEGLVLAGLSRALTRTAVQARLARFFAIYVSSDAACAALADRSSP